MNGGLGYLACSRHDMCRILNVALGGQEVEGLSSDGEREGQGGEPVEKGRDHQQKLEDAMSRDNRSLVRLPV